MENKFKLDEGITVEAICDFNGNDLNPETTKETSVQ
jgi:hypothetical protein